nr:CBS domain-containing protein [Rossellomorea vietnamensis]
MRVRDVMTAHAAACSAQNSFQSAADKMSSLGVGALHGTIQGVMSNHVVTVSPDAPIEEAAALMSQHQVHRLPVVANGNLVRMLALGDLAVPQQSIKKLALQSVKFQRKTAFIKMENVRLRTGVFLISFQMLLLEDFLRKGSFAKNALYTGVA